MNLPGGRGYTTHKRKEAMYRRMLSQLLALALLVTILVLALSACGGGGQEKAKARPLPLYETAKALRPGEYHSVKFKPPLSFKVGKGWWHTQRSCPTLSNWGKER
jgi:hypothetical protein